MNEAVLRHFNILYLEDEKNIRTNISKVLNYYFNQVFDVENVDMAMNILKTNSIDIILSDISMPGKNGIDFIKHIRENHQYIPVILLTAHTDTHYLLDATKLKLVDYLTKPIDFDELNTALLKAAQECLALNPKKASTPLSYNFKTKTLTKENNNITLTNKELLLFEYLLTHKNRVVTKDELFEHIWQDYFNATDSALKSLLNKLRKKIGKEYIKNVSGVGYQLDLITH